MPRRVVNWKITLDNGVIVQFDEERRVWAVWVGETVVSVRRRRTDAIRDGYRLSEHATQTLDNQEVQ